MATTFLEPGSDASFNVAVTGLNGGFWDSVNASPVSSTDFVHGGHQRSIKCLSGVSTNCIMAKFAVLADAGSRISFYFLFNTIPNGDLKINPVEIDTNGGATCFGITLRTTGKLAIYDKSNVVQATGNTVLSINTWYRISVTYTITNGTTNSMTVYLNGVSEVTASNISVTTASGASYFGFSETVYGATGVNMYYSDFYIDNQSSGDPGNIWVTAKRPNANGTTNGFTTQIGSGGSGYGTGHSPQVNERPLSNVNGWSMAGAGSAVTEEYNIESASTGDINISTATIVDYIGWVDAKSALSETGSIIVNGISSNIALGSEQVFIKVAGSTTYPSGTGADIGIITSTTVTTVSLYECGVLVAYIPVVVATITPTATLPLLGVG